MASSPGRAPPGAEYLIGALGSAVAMILMVLFTKHRLPIVVDLQLLLEFGFFAAFSSIALLHSARILGFLPPKEKRRAPERVAAVRDESPTFTHHTFRPLAESWLRIIDGLPPETRGASDWSALGYLLDAFLQAEDSTFETRRDLFRKVDVLFGKLPDEVIEAYLEDPIWSDFQFEGRHYLAA